MHFIIFVFIAVMFAACVQAGTTVPAGLQGNLSSSNCGGNCPGGCSSCPCGTSTNYQDINSWCSKYSWNQVNIFLKAEFGYIPPSLTFFFIFHSQTGPLPVHHEARVWR